MHYAPFPTEGRSASLESPSAFTSSKGDVEADGEAMLRGPSPFGLTCDVADHVRSLLTCSRQRGVEQSGSSSGS